MDILIILFWISVTFLTGSIIGVIGKRYGVEYLIALFSALVVMANIFANKIVKFGPLDVPAGVIAFSLTFFITDIISEVWGKEYSKKAVWAGFTSSLVLLISLFIVTHLEPAVFSIEISEMFSKVFYLTPRIILASFVAYLVSQNCDIWIFHFLREKTKRKHLWLRNNFSTIFSQFIDSTIFAFIAFYGVFPISNLIIGQFIVKTLIALIDTPFIYLSLTLINRTNPKQIKTHFN